MFSKHFRAKKEPVLAYRTVRRGTIAILDHNKPAAYLIPANTYETMLEQIEDYHWGLIVKERQHEKECSIEVNLDEL